VDGDCRDKFIAHVGLRTFRRPLAQAEVQRLRTMFVANASPLEGVRTVLEFLLQSPSFLYLANSHDPKVLPFVRAARLSYFLSNTTPSDATPSALASRSTTLLDDDMVDAISSLANLRDLRLAALPVTNAHLQRLAKQVTAIARLDLSGCVQITDAALDTLAEIKSLTWLNVSGTKVAAEGLQRFRESRADVRLVAFMPAG